MQLDKYIYIVKITLHIQYIAVNDTVTELCKNETWGIKLQTRTEKKTSLFKKNKDRIHAEVSKFNYVHFVVKTHRKPKLPKPISRHL